MRCGPNRSSRLLRLLIDQRRSCLFPRANRFVLTGFNIAGAASLGIRGKRVAWRGLTYPGLPCRQTDGAELVATLGSLAAVCVGSLLQRWGRSELLRPVVNAGTSPAGFSRTVVQRHSTTTLYTPVERSPSEAWFQRCCSTRFTVETRHARKMNA